MLRQLPAFWQRLADMISCVQIFAQLANEKGTKLYKLQKRFQRAFGFTLRKRAFPRYPLKNTRHRLSKI